MNVLSNYFIYFFIYGYIYLLFLKGYYPANETGILFIGFLIFMTLAYAFVGSMFTDELDYRRNEIYQKFELLLEQNYASLYLLRDIYNNISYYEGNLRQISLVYPNSLTNNITEKFNEEFNINLNYFVNNQLINVLKEQLLLTKNILNIGYILSIKSFIQTFSYE